jgi:hypothetical protein
VNLRTADPLHCQRDETVIEQQVVAFADVIGQALVGDTDTLDGTGLRIHRRIQHEGLALDQLHRAIAKALDADLRSLQIAKHGNVLATLFGHCAYRAHALFAGIGIAVREIDPHHIDTGLEELRKRGRIVGGRTKRCDDLGAPHVVQRRPLCARASSAATAGRVAPSRNSRKAPPPVET